MDTTNAPKLQHQMVDVYVDGFSNSEPSASFIAEVDYLLYRHGIMKHASLHVRGGMTDDLPETHDPEVMDYAYLEPVHIVLPRPGMAGDAGLAAMPRYAGRQGEHQAELAWDIVRLARYAYRCGMWRK